MCSVRACASRCAKGVCRVCACGISFEAAHRINFALPFIARQRPSLLFHPFGMFVALDGCLFCGVFLLFFFSCCCRRRLGRFARAEMCVNTPHSNVKMSAQLRMKSERRLLLQCNSLQHQRIPIFFETAKLVSRRRVMAGVQMLALHTRLHRWNVVQVGGKRWKCQSVSIACSHRIISIFRFSIATSASLLRIAIIKREK